MLITAYNNFLTISGEKTMAMERKKNEMRNVDLSGFKVKRTEMHPKSEELLQFCKSYFADDFDLIGVDLAESTFYTFPLMQNMAVPVTVFIVAGFFLDDYLDKFPEGA